MNEKPIEKAHQSNGSRQPYDRPTLQVYGALSELTSAAANAGSMDNGPSTTMFTH